MSAVTLAVLRDARNAALKPYMNSPEAIAYRDTMQKAPAPIAAVHLLLAAVHLAASALRVPRRRSDSAGTR